MPTTSKRPKLKKPISDPWRGEIAAGTILKWVDDIDSWRSGWDLGSLGPRKESAELSHPDWFEWVDVCDECDRESSAYISCNWCTEKSQCTQFCHGHVEATICRLCLLKISKDGGCDWCKYVGPCRYYCHQPEGRHTTPAKPTGTYKRTPTVEEEVYLGLTDISERLSKILANWESK